jgi:histone acetyltransferase
MKPDQIYNKISQTTKQQVSSKHTNKFCTDQSNFSFTTLKNDGSFKMMKKLIDLKNIFAKQLPKMPKEYIVRLMFDRKHQSIVIQDHDGVIFGGICFRVFEVVKLAEVVFLAVVSERQIKGFGTKIMNQLKAKMQERGIRILMTCADNLAIGYFQKQGFHREVLIPPVLYKGYLKDYEGSTLMECLLHKTVDYRHIVSIIRERKKQLSQIIKSKVNSNQIHKKLPQSFFILDKIKQKIEQFSKNHLPYNL